MTQLQINDGNSLYYVEVLDDDALTENTRAIRCRGPNGVMYAKPSLGAWKAVDSVLLRAQKEHGLA